MCVHVWVGRGGERSKINKSQVNFFKVCVCVLGGEREYRESGNFHCKNIFVVDGSYKN